LSIANKIVESLKKAVASGNADGIPVPTIRDPKSGKGSITATMTVVSFGVCVILLAGKVTKVVGDVDYNNALWLLGVSLGGYLGRKFQGDGKKISIDGASVDAPTEPK
jgi:hypothetical protein